MSAQTRGVVLSGCSGGGKSTVLQSLHELGYATVAEPGRRIVREQQQGAGTALPWVDAPAFARRCIDLARADLANARDAEWVFFDRGLVDAAVALHHYTGNWGCPTRELQRYRQHVFFTPPWPDIYASDAERQLEFSDAAAEYDRLHATYRELRYAVTVLPLTDVASRVQVILDCLDWPQPPGNS